MDIIKWHQILHPYEEAVDELVYKFRHIRREYQREAIYCPIERVFGRVKTVGSILEKMRRKDIPFEEMEEKVEDIAGIRIICQFVEDIDQIVELINRRNDMTVKQVKDYVRNQKESGYRSYHLIIYYKVQTIHGEKTVQAEIQIRTLAMDFWATIEHSLQYKYKANIPEHLCERLSSVADVTIQLEQEMSYVRSEIMDAQLSSQIQQRIVSNILNVIEKLYAIAPRTDVERIQEEFFKVYKMNDMDALRRFHKQLDVIAEGYQVQNVLPE